MKKYYMKMTKYLCVLMILFGALDSQDLFAQKKKKKKKGETEAVEKPAEKPKPKEKTIADLTKKSRKIEGLFTIYQDSTTGSLQMEISEDQLNKEFIYFSQVADGFPDAGAFRGAYGASQIFKIERYFDRLDFVVQNTSSYFDPDNALANSAKANMTDGIMASIKFTVHEKEKGKYLIKADNLFLKETLSQVKPPRFPGASPFAFSLGNLDASKTKINGIRNYEMNTDLAIEYAYSKSSAFGASRAVADARNASIKVFHSLIAMPDNDYQPRYDDPRVGYFTTQTQDMTSISATPFRDMVHRWDLKKKDPNAAISEPVEPITWWIENTTPMEIRPTIRAAANTWNEAFEKAGFRNAMVIKEQPDDADWDAGDIRYNVLRWTASPSSFFSGYGPSFVNPRTGQILGADIMLEYGSLGNTFRREELFETAGLDAIALSDNLDLDTKDYLSNPYTCMAGNMAQHNQMFGTIVLDVMNASEMEKSKMVEEFIHYLIIHEIGHTLGLNHNMKSSQMYGIDEIHDESKTSKTGLIGSIMDYPSINFAPVGTTQGQYYSKKPGPYDMWAIEFGYKDMSDAEMKRLLSKSAQPELAFGNDADDMRAPGRGIDPRVNTGDLTHDAIPYAMERISLASSILNKILPEYDNAGGTYQTLLNSYLTLTGQQSQSATTISRYIGGVYIDRTMIGDNGATKPFTPVDKATQKLAMKALSDHVFAPDAFAAPSDLYNYLASQRRGFNVGQAPQLTGRILGIQRGILAHLLHPSTMQRISDSEMYGNEYHLSEMMTALNSAIFDKDIAGNVNTFRQNLQLEYTNRLIQILNGNNSARYMHSTKSMVLYNLKNIRKMVTNTNGYTSSKAHKEHLRTLIDKALKD